MLQQIHDSEVGKAFRSIIVPLALTEHTPHDEEGKLKRSLNDKGQKQPVMSSQGAWGTSDPLPSQLGISSNESADSVPAAQRLFCEPLKEVGSICSPHTNDMNSIAAGIVLPTRDLTAQCFLRDF